MTYEQHGKIIYPLCWVRPVQVRDDNRNVTVLLPIPARATLRTIKSMLLEEFGDEYPNFATKIYGIVHG